MQTNVASFLCHNLFCFSILSHSTKDESKNGTVRSKMGHQSPEGE
jgi:hypothetical protein